jgi:hypothetical protein
MKKDSVNNFIDTVISYVTTKDLKKLWHFYLFIIIFNTWLEVTLFYFYRPLEMNFDVLMALMLGVIPIYAFSIYCIKFHAINKKRPYWVLPFLGVLIYFFLTPNSNALGYPSAPTLIRLYADHCIYLTFLTALRIMFVVKNKAH